MDLLLKNSLTLFSVGCSVRKNMLNFDHSVFSLWIAPDFRENKTQPFKGCVVKGHVQAAIDHQDSGF